MTLLLALYSPLNIDFFFARSAHENGSTRNNVYEKARMWVSEKDIYAQRRNKNVSL